jgi:hypothetical protein
LVFICFLNRSTSFLDSCRAAYVALLFGLVFASVVAISWYEKSYPLVPRQSDQAVNDLVAVSGEAAAAGDVTIEAAALHLVRVPPVWLDRFMAVVYPGSLGVDEGIAHLTMKVC